MLGSKVLLFAFLLLVADVFAGNVAYTAKYKAKEGAKDKIGRTSVLKEVADDKENEIIENMAQWSDNKYSASRSRHGFVQVINAVAAASKAEASDEIKEMRHIVAKHIRESD